MAGVGVDFGFSVGAEGGFSGVCPSTAAAGLPCSVGMDCLDDPLYDRRERPPLEG